MRRRFSIATVHQLTGEAQDAASALDSDASDIRRLAAAVQKVMWAVLEAEVLMARRAYKMKDEQRTFKALHSPDPRSEHQGSGSGVGREPRAAM